MIDDNVSLDELKERHFQNGLHIGQLKRRMNGIEEQISDLLKEAIEVAGELEKAVGDDMDLCAKMSQMGVDMKIAANIKKLVGGMA